jgi:hypothetical protein
LFEERGVAFAPVVFTQPVYLRPYFTYRPRCRVRTGIEFLVHLFVRPSYRCYYFGDWYGYTNFRRGGFYAWCDLGRYNRWYDPSFSYYRAARPRYQNTTVINWVYSQHRESSQRVDRRPPKTFQFDSREFADGALSRRDLDSNSRRAGADVDRRDRSRDLVDDFVRQARQEESRVDKGTRATAERRFTKVNASAIENLNREIAASRQLQDLRRREEKAVDSRRDPNDGLNRAGAKGRLDITPTRVGRSSDRLAVDEVNLPPQVRRSMEAAQKTVRDLADDRAGRRAPEGANADRRRETERDQNPRLGRVPNSTDLIDRRREPETGRNPVPRNSDHRGGSGNRSRGEPRGGGGGGDADGGRSNNDSRRGGQANQVIDAPARENALRNSLPVPATGRTPANKQFQGSRVPPREGRGTAVNPSSRIDTGNSRIDVGEPRRGNSSSSGGVRSPRESAPPINRSIQRESAPSKPPRASNNEVRSARSNPAGRSAVEAPRQIQPRSIQGDSRRSATPRVSSNSGPSRSRGDVQPNRNIPRTESRSSPPRSGGDAGSNQRSRGRSK